MFHVASGQGTSKEEDNDSQRWTCSPLDTYKICEQNQQKECSHCQVLDETKITLKTNGLKYLLVDGARELRNNLTIEIRYLVSAKLIQCLGGYISTKKRCGHPLH